MYQDRGEVQKPEKSKSSSRQKVYTSKVKVKFVPKFFVNGYAWFLYRQSTLVLGLGSGSKTFFGPACID